MKTLFFLTAFAVALGLGYAAATTFHPTAAWAADDKPCTGSNC